MLMCNGSIVNNNLIIIKTKYHWFILMFVDRKACTISLFNNNKYLIRTNAKIIGFNMFLEVSIDDNLELIKD